MNYIAITPIKIMVLILSSFLLSACTSEAPIEPEKIELSQLEHNWKLTHIDNIKLATIINSSLVIDNNHNCSGNLGCNSFHGQAVLTENQLNINELNKTLKSCSHIENSVEADVSTVLNETATVMLDKQTLIISNDKHSLTYHLED